MLLVLGVVGFRHCKFHFQTFLTLVRIWFTLCILTDVGTFIFHRGNLLYWYIFIDSNVDNLLLLLM